MTTQQLQLEAMMLSPQSRFQLARFLLNSLGMSDVMMEDSAVSAAVDHQNGTATKQPNLYEIHEHAVDIGVYDLAENIDHYLYGLEKRDE